LGTIAAKARKVTHAER
jgi:hypothetical protein